ncbi:hypothetical protein HDV04_005960 [Boothiomyces sp. JEL0838]|nr:hypothetical protein HDV04_005960 [Boothiomyces sp. JEL0838]
MPDSFLFGICDFHVNYAGCGQFAFPFQIIDYITGSLYIISALGYIGILIVQLLRNGLGAKPIRAIWSRMDTICLLAPVMLIFRSIYSFNTSTTARFAFNPTEYTNADIEAILKVSISFDYLFFLLGAITLSLFVFMLVDMAGRLNTNLESYNLWRRCFYALYGFVALFVSFPIVLSFGTIVLSKLKKKKSNVSNLGTTDQSVLPKKISKRDQTEYRVKTLGYLIKSTAWWLYFLISLMMLGYIIFYEFFNQNRLLLLVVKVVFDLYYWTNSSYALKYFFFRLQATADNQS